LFDTHAKNLSGPCRLKLIKTYANGWVSSYRMHEDVLLNCLLGCKDAPDDNSHYISCKHLQSINKFLTGGTSEAPLIRWGLSEPTLHNLKVGCCTFSGYHAVKARLREQQTRLRKNTILDNPLIRVNWLKYAEAFSAEADELAISSRQFTVPSFLAFLLAGSPDSYSESNRLPRTANGIDALQCSPCLSQGAMPSQSQSSNTQT